MRSSLPKVLHPVCGVPMVELGHRGRARRPAPTASSASRGPGEGRGRALPPAPRPPSSRGRGHRRRRARRTRGARAERARDRPQRRRAAHRAAELIAGLRRRARARGRGRHPAHDRGARPDRATAASSAAATGCVERIVETKPTDGVPEEVLAIREINIGTYVFDGPELVRARSTPSGVEPNGERYLTSVLPDPARARPEDRRSHDRRHARREGREQPRRPDGGHPSRPAADPRPARASGGHVPGARLGGDRRGSRDRRGHDGRRRGHAARRHARSASGCEIGPQTTITDSELGDEIAVPHSFLTSCTRRRPRVDRPLRLPAPRGRHPRRREGRHLRGGQEVDRPRGRQGAPSLLHRRRGRRQSRQSRRPARSPRTTTAAARPARRSGRASTRASTRPRRTCERRRRGVHWRRIGDHRRRAGWRARGIPAAAEEHRGLRQANG